MAGSSIWAPVGEKGPPGDQGPIGPPGVPGLEYLRYLAASPVDPTLRDDGSPLQIGDSYLNTSTNVIMYYGSGGWYDPNPSAGIVFATLADPVNPLNGARRIGYRGRTADVKMDENLSIMDSPYSAVCDGVIDDTAAIQGIVTTLANRVASPASGVSQGRIVFPPNKVVKITGTVLVPGGIEIDLNGCTILGGGLNTNSVFESAYLTGGNLVSNVGTTPQSHLVVNQKIHNGTFRLCGRALNLYNCVDNCTYGDFLFSDCTFNLYTTRCFFVTYYNMMSRGTAGGATNEAYHFDTDVNAVTLDNVTCNGRALGFKFSGGVNGMTWRNVNAESCTVGFGFADQVTSVSVQGGYVEFNTTAGFDFTATAGVYNFTIDGTYFNGNQWPIIGLQMFGGRIGPGCYYVNNTSGVVISDASSTIEVCIPEQQILTNGAVALPVGWNLGAKVRITGRSIIYASGGAIQVAQNMPNMNGVVPLNRSGSAGSIPSGVPFCTNSLIGATAVVDTKIAVLPNSKVDFSITIVDSAVTTFYDGQVKGTRVYMQSALGGKTVVATNLGGFLRLEFSTHTAGYTISGDVTLI